MKRILIATLLAAVCINASAANNQADEDAAWSAVIGKFNQPMNSKESFLKDINVEASRLGFQISGGQLADINTNDFKSGDETMKKHIIATVVGLTLAGGAIADGTYNTLNGGYTATDSWDMTNGTHHLTLNKGGNTYTLDVPNSWNSQLSDSEVDNAISQATNNYTVDLTPVSNTPTTQPPVTQPPVTSKPMTDIGSTNVTIPVNVGLGKTANETHELSTWLETHDSEIFDLYGTVNGHTSSLTDLQGEVAKDKVRISQLQQQQPTQGQKGDKGDKGDTGPQGKQGVAGKDGAPGKDGVTKVQVDTATQQKVAANTSKLADHDKRITKNESDIKDNTKHISDVETVVNNNADALVNVQDTTNAVIDGVNNHEQRIDVLEHSSVGSLAPRVNNNSQRIQKLEAHDKEQDKRISENNERAMAGVASALAVTGLHYTDSANSIAAGAGNYGGQSAVSVGYSHQWGTSARFSVQNSVDTTGNVGTSASVAIGW